MSARVLFTSRVCIYRKEEEEEEVREKRNITEKKWSQNREATHKMMTRI